MKHDRREFLKTTTVATAGIAHGKLPAGSFKTAVDVAVTTTKKVFNALDVLRQIDEKVRGINSYAQFLNNRWDVQYWQNLKDPEVPEQESAFYLRQAKKEEPHLLNGVKHSAFKHLGHSVLFQVHKGEPDEVQSPASAGKQFEGYFSSVLQQLQDIKKLQAELLAADDFGFTHQVRDLKEGSRDAIDRVAFYMRHFKQGDEKAERLIAAAEDSEASVATIYQCRNQLFSHLISKGHKKLNAEISEKSAPLYEDERFYAAGYSHSPASYIYTLATEGIKVPFGRGSHIYRDIPVEIDAPLEGEPLTRLLGEIRRRVESGFLGMMKHFAAKYPHVTPQGAGFGNDVMAEQDFAQGELKKFSAKLDQLQSQAFPEVKLEEMHQKIEQENKAAEKETADWQQRIGSGYAGKPKPGSDESWLVERKEDRRGLR